MKNLTILLTLIITSCAYIPDTLIVKDEGFKRDVRGDFILKTTKENNPYLQEDFVVNDIELVLNPLPRLKKKPVVVYYNEMNDVINGLITIYNDKGYKYIGYYSSPTEDNKFSKKEMEEAGILLGANLLIIADVKKGINADGSTERLKYEVAFIRTKKI